MAATRSLMVLFELAAIDIARLANLSTAVFALFAAFERFAVLRFVAMSPISSRKAR
jgi:hypothetical protein